MLEVSTIDGVETTDAVEPMPEALAPLDPASAFPADGEVSCDSLPALQKAAQAGLLTSSLTHDVNNHLQSILGFAGMALRMDDPDAWRGALEMIQQRCVDLEETNRVFLDFVKQPSIATYGAFRLSEVVERASTLVAPLANSRHVDVSPLVLVDAPVRGQPRLAVQALVNLVTNSIRACADREGSVVIEASRSGEDRCRLKVIDDGPGIPPAIRDDIFRPLVTSRAESGGHGLGLFIVRRIVESMHGTVEARTSSGGTTFVIDLPIADEPPGEQQLL
jgi:signal transduction histidine kinase